MWISAFDKLLVMVFITVFYIVHFLGRTLILLLINRIKIISCLYCKIFFFNVALFVICGLQQVRPANWHCRCLPIMWWEENLLSTSVAVL